MDFRSNLPRRLEEQERFFLLVTAAFVLLLGCFLVLRDPVWRLLHRSGFSGTDAARPGAQTEMADEILDAVQALNSQHRTGLESIEGSLMEALNRRRAAVIAGVASLEPLARAEDVTGALRARAAAHASGATYRSTLALRFPEVQVGLSLPGRLVHVATSGQHLSKESLERAQLEEVVGGWMNLTAFAAALQRPKMQAGVGAVPMPDGGAYVEVALIEIVANLNQPLTIPVAAGRLRINLQPQPGGGPELLLRGPGEATFTKMQCQSEPAQESCSADLQPGRVYWIRAAAGDRTSDPVPLRVGK